jgi:hypothetical protein
VTATTKRKTAARKPAKRAPSKQIAPVNGTAVNGNGLRPPEEFVPREREESASLAPDPEVPPHEYGDRRVQVFTPSEGEPIVVPHISTVPVTEEFLWENHRKKLDLMHQSWAWLNLANIPEYDQRRIIKLNLTDKRRFWQEWFQGFVPPPSGEPPGES